jgi:hypothetical protein
VRTNPPESARATNSIARVVPRRARTRRPIAALSSSSLREAVRGSSTGGHGECGDGADNDRDSYFDCDDHDCAGSPDCAAADDPDTDSDTDTDTDTDGDTGDTGNTDTAADDTAADSRTGLADGLSALTSACVPGSIDGACCPCAPAPTYAP